MLQPTSPELAAHLKSLYASYRQTLDIDAKGAFFSPSCYQICRPKPDYAASNRETIVRYLHEAANTWGTAPGSEAAKTQKKKSHYTIRSLAGAELEFGGDELVKPAGFEGADEVKRKAVEEGWMGMRVDLWDDEGVDEEGKSKGMLVKVQYWWRKEDGQWVQIFHDIMYIGPRDGSEGKDAEILD